MENDMNQLESVMDSKIRQFLFEEGYLFPMTDQEIEDSLRECAEQNIIIPPHLDNPLIYLQSPASREPAKVIALPPHPESSYIKDFTALAAREGTGDIPPEILEQMKKDRENHPDE